MLVDEHSNRDAAHVEPVQEVLDVLIGDHILGKDLFVFHDPLSHGRHHVVVSVSNGNQCVCKTKEGRAAGQACSFLTL